MGLIVVCADPAALTGLVKFRHLLAKTARNWSCTTLATVQKIHFFAQKLSSKEFVSYSSPGMSISSDRYLGPVRLSRV